MSIKFEAWPKTTRLFRDITITEKIDGTNACVIFERPWGDEGKTSTKYEMACQSRNKLITPGKTTDNAGFAQWAYDNSDALFEKLGYGRHFGEWWGPKVTKSSYNMDHKVFSIFNSDVWDVQVDHVIMHPIGDAVLTHTPVLYRGPFSQAAIEDTARHLIEDGSMAASWFDKKFDKPEGVCIFHSQTRTVQKFTFDNNDAGKWETL